MPSGLAPPDDEDITGATIVWSGDTVDPIEVPDLPPFPIHELIDRLIRTASAAATILVDDATSHVCEIDQESGWQPCRGDRPRQDIAAYAAIKEGRRFTSEAAILSAPYLTVYTPIKNIGSQVIGVLFTGIPEAGLPPFGGDRPQKSGERGLALPGRSN